MQETKFDTGTWKHGDLILIICSALNMLARVVFGINNRNNITYIINSINNQAQRRNIKWNESVTIGFLALLCGNCTWYICGLISTTVWKPPYLYRVFDVYYTAFVTNYFVSTFETYYIFQLVWAIRRIFESINDEVKQTKGEKCVEDIRRCARAHYNAVLLAERTNEAFGIILASSVTSYFVLFITTAHSCCILKERMLKHIYLFKYMIQNGVWIVLTVGGLITTIRTWNTTLITVRPDKPLQKISFLLLKQ